MQNPVVVIGGLEKSYMQKLALYLNTRIGKDGYVELLEGSARQTDMVHQNVKNTGSWQWGQNHLWRLYRKRGRQSRF